MTTGNKGKQCRALLESELARYVQVLREHYAPQRILLFDSLASGKTFVWQNWRSPKGCTIFLQSALSATSMDKLPMPGRRLQADALKRLIEADSER